MKSRLVLSDASITDILEQFNWYAQIESRKLAERWEEGVTSTLLHIIQRPGLGSLCKFSTPELADTRRIPVADFPKHLIFYQARRGEVLVLRVVHGARDLESLFAEGWSRS